MPIRVKPLSDRILVKKAQKKEQQTPTGLFIPETVTEKGGASTGLVIDVGDGIYSEKGEFIRPLNVKAGQTVIFGKYAGVEAHLNSEEFLLMQEVDILGVLVEE